VNLSLSFKPISALFFGVLAACSNATGKSNEVDQTNIFGDYTVIQDANSGKVTLLTWFRYAGQTGTTLRLTEGSSIAANNQKMSLVEGSSQILNFTGSFYTNSFHSSAQTGDYTFVWNRNDGKVFQNSIPAPKKIEAVVMMDGPDVIRAGQTARISRSQSGFTATYDGSDLGDGEAIECSLWTDSEGDNATSDFTTSAKWNSNLKNCVFKKESLQRFRVGSARLRMLRKWNQRNLAKGHERAGSNQSSLYEAQSIAVEILP
jgi:hypothetical protein